MSKSKIKVIAEDVEFGQVDVKYLTNDCYVIFYSEEEEGRVMSDIVKGKRVDIFDEYYDLGMRIRRIDLAGGYRNPKNSESEVVFKQ
jgi:predicted RNA-binding protein